MYPISTPIFRQLRRGIAGGEQRVARRPITTKPVSTARCVPRAPQRSCQHSLKEPDGGSTVCRGRGIRLFNDLLCAQKKKERASCSAVVLAIFRQTRPTVFFWWGAGKIIKSPLPFRVEQEVSDFYWLRTPPVLQFAVWQGYGISHKRFPRPW